MINNEQSEMIDLLMGGVAISAIGRTLNKSRGTIYNWMNITEVIDEIELRKTELRKNAKDRILNGVEGCIDNMKYLAANSTDVRVRFQANRYLIDRALGTPVATKEETEFGGKENSSEENTLRNELDAIKNIRVIK